MTLGEVGKFYAPEVEDMIREMNRALRGSMAITMMLGIEERVFAYARLAAQTKGSAPARAGPPGERIEIDAHEMRLARPSAAFNCDHWLFRPAQAT